MSEWTVANLAASAVRIIGASPPESYTGRYIFCTVRLCVWGAERPKDAIRLRSRFVTFTRPVLKHGPRSLKCVQAEDSYLMRIKRGGWAA